MSKKPGLNVIFGLIAENIKAIGTYKNQLAGIGVTIVTGAVGVFLVNQGNTQLKELGRISGTENLKKFMETSVE